METSFRIYAEIDENIGSACFNCFWLAYPALGSRVDTFLADTAKPLPFAEIVPGDLQTEVVIEVGAWIASIAPHEEER
jgi:hypothetical protein